jgi:hypothetical protein
VIGALAVHVGLKPLLALGGALLVVAALVVALVDVHVVALVVDVNVILINYPVYAIYENNKASDVNQKPVCGTW